MLKKALSCKKMNFYINKRKKIESVMDGNIVTEKALRRACIHSKKGHQEKQTSPASQVLNV